jgi:hypothetical protein
MLNWKICQCRSGYFDEVLGASYYEPENVLYMDGKPRMSSFQNFLRFVIWNFLEGVMAVQVREGHFTRGTVNIRKFKL